VKVGARKSQGQTISPNFRWNV